MFSGFDSRHTQKESAKSSFLIFSHLTFQGASAGLIFFTKSISSLQGPLYQMSQSIIVSVSCSQSKYSSWQLGRGLEEWEEAQNVKCGGTNTMKRFVCRWMVHGSFFCGFVPWALSKAQHKACQHLHSSISQGESLRHPSFTLRQSWTEPLSLPQPGLPMSLHLSPLPPHCPKTNSMDPLTTWRELARALWPWPRIQHFRQLITSYTHEEARNLCWLHLMLLCGEGHVVRPPTSSHNCFLAPVILSKGSWQALLFITL